MKQKIIRVSETTHADFKVLVAKFPEFNISTATEELIRIALKRGQIKISKNENAYDAVKELDQTFRKWMRQQEKMHLNKISEELLALAIQLKETPTENKVQEILENQHKRILEKVRDMFVILNAAVIGKEKGYFDDRLKEINWNDSCTQK